jgi:general secretion pathway protein B
MSYILDALRKAERERHLGQPPTLATLPPPAESSRRRLGWGPILGLGLGLNAVLLALFLNRPPLVTDPAPSSPPPESPVATLPAKPAPAPIQPRKPPAGATAPVSPPPRSVPTRAAAPTPPLLDTLPANIRRGMPTLNLDIHVYSPDTGRRFVVINGRRYREGDALEEGPVLEAVIADGAVLRHGGQRFRLPVRR